MNGRLTTLILASIISVVMFVSCDRPQPVASSSASPMPTPPVINVVPQAIPAPTVNVDQASTAQPGGTNYGTNTPGDPAPAAIPAPTASPAM